MTKTRTISHSKDVLYERKRPNWEEFSVAELSIAHQLSMVIEEMCLDDASIVLLLKALASQLAGEEMYLPIPLTDVWKKIFIDEVVAATDLSAPFARDDNHITSNFLACLASRLWGRQRDLVTDGVVGTPPILAADMVELALSAHQRGTLCSNNIDTVKRAIDTCDLRWYDPCVGGGVFPVAIVDMLIRLGVPLPKEGVYAIYGRDVNTLAVEVTRLRVALMLSNAHKISFAASYDKLLHHFTVGDSLAETSEDPGIGLTFLFKTNGAIDTYDLVIGNPPYVRADRLSDEVKSQLRQRYPSVAGGRVDLYNYFISHGLLSLVEGGILCYVTPASFLKSRYGEKTREFVGRTGSLEALFDFDELPVFQGASVHACVYVLRRGVSQQEFVAHTFKELPEHRPLMTGLSSATVLPAANASRIGWVTHSREIGSLLELLMRDSIPLIQYVGEILSGVKAGHKEAFLIPQREAKVLAADPSSADYIRPMVRPVSIRKWRVGWDGTHIAFVRKGQVVPNESLLMRRFERYEAALRQRSDVQGHPTWYGLRACAYYEVFDQPKIVFPDIATECRFAMDLDGLIVPDGAFVLPVEDYFLLGLLNSCIGDAYFRARCNSIGNTNGRGRMRFKKTYVSSFPVPMVTESRAPMRQEVAKLARMLTHGEGGSEEERRIDQLVLALYDIPQDAWKTLTWDT